MEVVVSGNRSVLSKLKAEDIVVSADMTDVLQAVDDYTVELKASKNRSSTITDYTIERIKTRQVRVTCDYVGQTKYRVEKDISTVKVADDTKYQLGTPSLDSQLFPQESVTVSGPKKVRDQITRVAKVNQNKELKESTVLEAKLLAYDKNNKQVDLSGCTFPDLSEQEDPTIAQLTVPVNYFCRAELGIKATNLPEAYQDQEGFLTITPSSLELLGQDESGDWQLRVRCSKGTYVRTLCHDIGQALGCGGCMAALRREQAGAYTLAQAVPLEELLHHPDPASLLMPVDSLFAALPAAALFAPQEKKCRNGTAFSAGLADGRWRLYGQNGEFLALAAAENGTVRTIKSFFEVSV